MSPSHGKFVWYELMTTDTAAASAFYAAVIGWDPQDSGMPGVDYTLLHADGIRVGGMMSMPDHLRAARVPPHWAGYIAVADVDADAARVAAAGGTVLRAPDDIAHVGRFSVVKDPQGAMFVLFKPAEGPAPPAVPAGATGHVGWHELQAGDLQTVLPFYENLFGWTKDQAIDMGPMGPYQMFANQGAVLGGMMTNVNPASSPHWSFYVNVAGIVAAAARITANGGQILHGPQEVPGGSWIIQGQDPQGATFALVSAAR